MIKYFKWQVLLRSGEVKCPIGTHVTTDNGVVSVFDEDGLVLAIPKRYCQECSRLEEVEPHWRKRVKKLMETGKRIDAIRLYKDHIDAGLREAREACEEMIQ